MRKVVFLDRDGLINKKANEHDYIKTVSEFVLLPNVPEAIKLLNDAGYLVLIVTNQRGIARGIISFDDVNRIHEYMNQMLKECGASIEKIYVCPHEEGTCSCRKPDIGLFLQAENDFKIDKLQSWMVGDSRTDVEAGQRYGIRSILSENLYQAVKYILELR